MHPGRSKTGIPIVLLVPSFISRLWFKVINFQFEIFNTHITLVVYKQSKQMDRKVIMG